MIRILCVRRQKRAKKLINSSLAIALSPRASVNSNLGMNKAEQRTETIMILMFVTPTNFVEVVTLM